MSNKFISPLIIKNYFILFTVSILFFTVGISNQDAFAAIDMFLKIDGVDGEAVDVEHKGEIDVLAWSWGLTQSGTTHTGAGGGAGKVSVQDISITKYTDTSTPKLLESVATGDVFKEGELTLRKVGGAVPFEFETIIMKKILVSSVSMGGSAGEDPLTENITLNFEEFEVKYTEQQSDGSSGAIEIFSWNIATNTGGGSSGGGGTGPTDTDGDEVADTLDNCPTDFNPSQINSDFDDLGDACDADDDNDGIHDPVDTQRTTPSSDFSDGITSGTIIDSGDQTLIINDLSDPDGINIKSSSGSIPATISICGASTLSITSGDDLDATCGSVILNVIFGPVDVNLTSGESVGTTTLDTGDAITFDDQTFTVTNDGASDVIIEINGVSTTIGFGKTFTPALSCGLGTTQLGYLCEADTQTSQCAIGATLNHDANECEADVTQDDLDLLQLIIDNLNETIADLENSMTIAPSEIIDSLVLQIQTLVDGDILDKKDSKKVLKDLDKALKDLKKGNEKACKDVSKFVKDANKIVKKGDLDETTAQPLLDDANALLAECPVKEPKAPKEPKPKK